MKKSLDKIKIVIPFIFVFLIVSGCQKSEKQSADEKIKDTLLNSIEPFKEKYKTLVLENKGSNNLPSGCNENGLQKVEPESWVSGFFPGSLWYMYELTTDEFWKENAMYYTELLTEQQFNQGTHDLGFMMFNSFGNGYRLTQNEEYIPILLESANSLASRYNPKAGLIKSWDFPGWWEQYPVIIDNMMNLELLIWASKQSKDDRYREIAVTHSKNTLNNHFMENGTAYHVVDYDTISGVALGKGTFQGFADSSAWARGQAWALYGFTYMYKETQLEIFLEKAEQTASFILNNLTDDYIPYWDYFAPDIPNEPKDASAGAIMASALIDLYNLNIENSNNYLDYAEKILMSLYDNYLDKEDGCGFLINHSVVSKPHNAGIDVFLNYADYYYLEACIKYLKL